MVSVRGAGVCIVSRCGVFDIRPSSILQSQGVNHEDTFNALAHALGS